MGRGKDVSELSPRLLGADPGVVRWVRTNHPSSS